jgi:hypothetical protein
MTSIYVLTEGDYSDYHIVGVYSTKELAKEAQSLYEYSQIEEYDDITTSQVGPFDGTIPREFEYKSHNGETAYFVYCWAVDEDHAEKIALDKYYQNQATKFGIVS